MTFGHRDHGQPFGGLGDVRCLGVVLTAIELITLVTIVGFYMAIYTSGFYF